MWHIEAITSGAWKAIKVWKWTLTVEFTLKYIYIYCKVMPQIYLLKFNILKIYILKELIYFQIFSVWSHFQ